jgi:hypothetical protein
MTARNITNKRRWKQIRTPEGMQLTMPADDTLAHIGIPASIDPYATSAIQEYPLGSMLEYGLEVYRYALEGGVGVEIAALCQAVDPLAGHIAEVIAAAAIGDTTITFTPNTATTDDLAENELAEGYIYIYDGTGEGAKYRIKSHPAITGGTAGVITLYDPIRLTTPATATATVIHNKFRKFIIHPTTKSAAAIGWTVAAVPINYYCWLQTKGPCCALIDGTVVMGKEVRPSEDDEGAVAALDYNEATVADLGKVGRVMEIGANAGGGAGTYGFIWATLE